MDLWTLTFGAALLVCLLGSHLWGQRVGGARALRRAQPQFDAERTSLEGRIQQHEQRSLALDASLHLAQQQLGRVSSLLRDGAPLLLRAHEQAQLSESAVARARVLFGALLARGGALTGHAEALEQHVGEAITALEETTFSSNEVARNIGELNQSCKETAAAMTEMDRTIGQVEANANETSRLTAQVSADAERGVEALQKTLMGIEKIRDTGQSAAEVITGLGQKILEVGHILNVIDDVAEQTNLLALNAAIIAAQAGEHGRGFAVVADEIKALAERTGSSTKEIADLIRTIQAQSLRATDAMGQGQKSMEEGVLLGHNAQAALVNIVGSAKRSTEMMQSIAGSTVEQARGSKQVTTSVGHIANTVQQIFYASAEQARGSANIMQSAVQIRSTVAQVRTELAQEVQASDKMDAEVVSRLKEMGTLLASLRDAHHALSAEIKP